MIYNITNKNKDNYYFNWKGVKGLTFIDRDNKKHMVQYKGKTYRYCDIVNAYGLTESQFREVDGVELKYVLESGFIKSIQTNVLNESSYDWNHIDPVTGMPRKKVRPEDSIELMSRMPARSCWITLLQNRVNFNSVGNVRFKRDVWFDRVDRTVSSDKSKEDAVYFRDARLKDGSYPHGWIYSDKR